MTTVGAEMDDPKKNDGPEEFINSSDSDDKDEDDHHHHHDGKQEQELTEETFANYVEEAKKELKKQVICMFVFSVVFTFAIYGLFYWLIENQYSW